MYKNINIIGGGLAGCEAAFQLAERGIKVTLYEMRKGDKTGDAHSTDKLAELVCSNSLRSDDVKQAIGLLHEELRRLGSLIMKCADENKVPAGGALAVDREDFADCIQSTIENHPNITVIRKEIVELPAEDNENFWIIATGPNTSKKLFESLQKEIGEDHLSFYDAIAPIIYKDSIDFTKAWYQSRYDKGDSHDYINCPLTKEEYENFIDEILAAEKVEFHEWEKKDIKYFDGCLPIEVMAERGRETPRFGPMKPVGLTNPHNPEVKSYAIVQLRQDNKLGTIYNIVGFQTKMKYGEQKRVFRTIPGLEKAEFARFGGIHRNTFLNSPSLLDKTMKLKSRKNIRFAGQVSGVEGYIESTSMGMLAGILTACELMGGNSEEILPPATTAMGALLNHITVGHVEGRDDTGAKTFQPMNVNHGIFPPLKERVKKKERKQAYSDRALKDFEGWKERL